MVHGVSELLWIRLLLIEIVVPPKEPIFLYCDNNAARKIANNPVQHDRTKNIEVDTHFIKEKLKQRLVDIPFVRSSEQLAYVLTHTVPVETFRKSLNKLGL